MCALSARLQDDCDGASDAMWVISYLESTRACCRLEGVCDPSKQSDCKQRIVVVLCNHF